VSESRFRAAGLSMLRAPLGSAGILIFAFHKLWCLILNDHRLKPIPPAIQEPLSTVAPSEVDLTRVRVADRAKLALPTGFRAITLGRRIYIRGWWDPERPGDFQLLVHELVHVAQYERDTWGWLGFAAKYGAGVAGTWRWARHPMEKEAVRYEHDVADTLARHFKDRRGGGPA